ncbi:MAG: hypothetical protein K1Y01_03925, partial [Vicinamibacteria bacterium]|nr:hypothetical protein [Vicinamibacteria bacterium]
MKKLVISSLVPVCFILGAGVASAATFTVNSTLHGTDGNGATTTLVEAIQQANAAGGSNTIVLPAATVFVADDALFLDGTSAGRTMYPAITTSITIQGNGSTLDATGKNARFFYVSGSGSLTLDQINLVGGKAQGGTGAGGNFAGGGGGAGMGGAIFVNGSTASLIMRRASITNSAARGGTGTVSAFIGGPGGGGGGMGGDAGSLSVAGAQSGGGGPRTAATGASGGDGVGGNAGANNGGFGGGGGGGVQAGGAGTGGFGGGGGGGWTGSPNGYGLPGAGGFGGGGGGVTNVAGDGQTGGSGGAFGGRGGAYNTSGFAMGGGGAGLGGGIFNLQGTVTLENVTLSTNSAVGGDGNPNNGVGAGSGAGGGLFNYDGVVTLKHVTVSGNTVQTGVDNPGVATGGAVYNYDAPGGAAPSMTLFNSVLANSTFTNAVGAEAVNSGSGTLTASGAASTNLIESSSGVLTGTVLTVDPALGLLARYGGVIGIVPGSGSPLVNAGDNANSLATDAFGMARPQSGIVDIGAVEGGAASTFTLSAGMLLMSEAGLDAVLAVDPANGNRTLVSKFGVVGSGPAITNPLGIAVNAAQDIYVVDSTLDAVVKISPTNGNRTLISIGADDATANAVNGNAAVGSGPSFQSPTGIAIRGDGKLVVTDGGATTGVFSDAVFLVDPATGNRSILSDDTVPNTSNPLTTPNGIIVHSTQGILVADSTTTDTVTKVDGATGARTIFSSNTVPDGVNPISNPIGLAEDTNGTILLVENNTTVGANRQLLRLNATTGARTVVSNLSTTLAFSGVAAGSAGIFVTSTTTPDSLYQVNASTGAITLISNSNVGDGVLLANNLNNGLVMIPAGAGAPEMNVKGNSVSIADGDATPSSTDHTDFGSATIGVSTVVRTF